MRRIHAFSIKINGSCRRHSFHPTLPSSSQRPHMPKSPSVISRVIDILNLFSEDKAVVTLDEVSAALGMSTPSTYRYTSDLCQAGLLSRSASGCYRLGPKIIELEYLIQSYDPILNAGRDLMERLAHFTGCNVLLCTVYEHTIINMLHVTGMRPIRLSYTKGMRMPLFRGAQAHIILAYMERRKLKRLYEAALADPTQRQDALSIGADWKAFSQALKGIRAQGHYISRHQLDADITGIAAPVFGENSDIVGSLVLIHASQHAPDMTDDTLTTLLRQSADEISKRLQHA